MLWRWSWRAGLSRPNGESDGACEKNRFRNHSLLLYWLCNGFLSLSSDMPTELRALVAEVLTHARQQSHDHEGVVAEISHALSLCLELKAQRHLEYAGRPGAGDSSNGRGGQVAVGVVQIDSIEGVEGFGAKLHLVALGKEERLHET